MDLPNIKDKYYITYGIFYLLGILTFIPNYFVITANRYWMFKFRHMGPRPKPDDINVGPGPPAERNILQASFPSCYYLSWQLSLIIFVILTAAHSKKLPPPDKRISAALLCALIFYIVNLIFGKLITDSFQVHFFFLVMTIACFLGICSAVILVSLFEMVRKFPAEYYTAILTAQALCGVISAMIQIITICATEMPTYGGLFLFSLGTALVVVTIAVYWYSKRNSQYFIYNVGNDAATLEVTFQHRRLFPRIWMKIKSSSKHIKMCLSSLIIVTGATAIVYPGFMSLVVAEKSTGKTNNPWAETYFVPVITFLVASLCDLCGRVLAAKWKKPSNQHVILGVAICRLSFVPLILFCNAQPRMHLHVVFSDAHYIIFTIMMSFSNGYLVSLCVTLVPTLVCTEEEKSSVTVMVVISAVLSSATSSFLSLLLVHLI